MGLRRTVTAKPDHPAWAELVAEIESVVSLRYVEDPDAPWGPSYTPSEEEPGFSFESLNRADRQNVLADMVSWGSYESQGISQAQQRIVIANVLDGKPQEKWLEAVFDKAVLENDKIANFKTLVTIMKYSPDSHVFGELNGDRHPWNDLSAVAKVRCIARDAVYCDVPFEPFAQVAKDTIDDVGEALLRVVFDSQKEMHASANALQQVTFPIGVDGLSPRDAADFWWCQGLVPPWVAEDRRRHQNSEPKDHGNPENLAPLAAEAARDGERKLVWMETIRRLDAAYAAVGTDALAKMNGIEIHVLYAEKVAELDAVKKSLVEHGDNEISQMHKQKLERQTAGMAAWMRVHCPDFREMEQKASKTSLAELKAEARKTNGHGQEPRGKDLER